MKLLICTLTVLATMAPVWAQTQPQVWVEPHPEVQLIGEATQTNDGLSIAPITVPTSDIARIMDIKMWRFRIQTSAINPSVGFRLELRRPEQKTTVLKAGSFELTADAELVFALMPKNGEAFSKAETLKVYFRAHDLAPKHDTNDGVGRGDGGYNGEFKKEIKTLTFDSYSGGGGDWAFIGKNGDIDLMSFDNWGNPPTNKLVLVLNVPSPPTKRKE